MPSDDCHIQALPKPRGGRSRYWCLSHEASATARFGARMARCEGAYRSIADYRRFRLDPAEFPGGVALWGAVEPVYNTAAEPAERGIHVHARTQAGGASLSTRPSTRSSCPSAVTYTTTSACW